jgi:hypothetical protein
MKNWGEEAKKLVIDTLSDKADGMCVFLSNVWYIATDAHIIV